MKEGVLLFNAARERGLEGIIAKHSRSAYRIGRRSRKWLKVKTRFTQDCVIAGFMEPRGRRKYSGSLVLGAFEGNELIYVGHSGGGFRAEDLRGVYERLEPLVPKRYPFKTEPAANAPVTWVEPQLVYEVEFAGWTKEGIMRQPVFSRLREDKAAREAVREKPGVI